LGRIEKKSNKLSIDEWNKIPKSFIQKLFKNFIKRCKKIIELNGGRLEPVHLKQIRKDAEIEEKEEKEDKEIIDTDEKEVIENSESKKLKLKIIYNKNELFQKAKKEIALIRKKIKEKKREIRKAQKEYNKAKKYSMKIGKKTEAVTDKESAKKIKNIELQNYNFRIKWIKKCISENPVKYFKYFKNECKKMEIEEETMASTIDGEIKNIC
jgi:hypothetical protein